LLVHICCSVDSHYFIKKIKENYPNEEIIGYFYNPNIHPYSEYLLRFNDVKRSCDKYHVKLIDGGYNIKDWFHDIKGLEDAPEKGARCSICFEHRFEYSAKVAFDLKQNKFTSTLLMSPKKSLEQLTMSGQNQAKKYGLEFLSVDYRSGGGTNEQFKIAKEDHLYHQNYCGCMFALKKQRVQQNKIDTELFKNILNQCEPNSIEEKIETYNRIYEYEKKSINYELIRISFLNYRLLQGFLKVDNNTIDSYILRFSNIKREYSKKLKISFEINEVYYLNRDNIKIITIDYLNKNLQKNYKNLEEFYKNPISCEEEDFLRFKIEKINNSTSSIFIINNINNLNKNSKFTVFVKSVIYDDVKELLVKK
jgi:predicted adenine nucleotide alpha hydrolase (AANH) superfamily ATPase